MPPHTLKSAKAGFGDVAAFFFKRAPQKKERMVNYAKVKQKAEKEKVDEGF